MNGDSPPKRLPFTRPSNHRKLSAEIQAIPGVTEPSPIPDPLGNPTRRSLVQTEFSPTSNDIEVWVDGKVPQSVIDQITAVVNAHDATPDPVPDPPDYGTAVPDNFAFLLKQQIKTITDYIDMTPAQSAQFVTIVPALKAGLRVLLYVVKRTNGR